MPPNEVGAVDRSWCSARQPWWQIRTF